MDQVPDIQVQQARPGGDVPELGRITARGQKQGAIGTEVHRPNVEDEPRQTLRGRFARRSQTVTSPLDSPTASSQGGTESSLVPDRIAAECQAEHRRTADFEARKLLAVGQRPDRDFALDVPGRQQPAVG